MSRPKPRIENGASAFLICCGSCIGIHRVRILASDQRGNARHYVVMYQKPEAADPDYVTACRMQASEVRAPEFRVWSTPEEALAHALGNGGIRGKAAMYRRAVERMEAWVAEMAAKHPDAAKNAGIDVTSQYTPCPLVQFHTGACKHPGEPCDKCDVAAKARDAWKAED